MVFVCNHRFVCGIEPHKPTFLPAFHKEFGLVSFPIYFLLVSTFQLGTKDITEALGIEPIYDTSAMPHKIVRRPAHLPLTHYCCDSFTAQQVPLLHRRLTTATKPFQHKTKAFALFLFLHLYDANAATRT